MDRVTKKLKMPPLSCLLLTPLTVCAADGDRVSMAPFTVERAAGALLNVVPLDHSDSPLAMTFLPDQSLLVKAGALWLFELARQSLGQGNTAAETVPSVVRRTPVTGLPDVRAAKQEYYDHRSPLGVEKRVSQTLH